MRYYLGHELLMLCGFQGGQLHALDCYIGNAQCVCRIVDFSFKYYHISNRLH